MADREFCLKLTEMCSHPMNVLEALKFRFVCQFTALRLLWNDKNRDCHLLVLSLEQ